MLSIRKLLLIFSLFLIGFSLGKAIDKQLVKPAYSAKWGGCPEAVGQCPSGLIISACVNSVEFHATINGTNIPRGQKFTVDIYPIDGSLTCSDVTCLVRELRNFKTDSWAGSALRYSFDKIGCSSGACNNNYNVRVYISPSDALSGSQYCQIGNPIQSWNPIQNATSRDFTFTFNCTPPPTNTPTPTLQPRPPPCPIPSGLIGTGGNYGDVDGNGQITQNDVDKTSRIVAGISATQGEIEAADVNDAPNIQSAMDDVTRDVTSTDTALILQYINRRISTFPVCEQPTATQTPTPTSIPNACNVDCTYDSECQADIYSSSNTCTACVNNKCQVPLTPTPIPACNAPCASDSYCQNANDGCTDCNPTTNTCQVPLTPTGIPSGAPSSTPVPTGPPPPTATLTPTSIPPPTATPTPSFNPDACKCDGIDNSGIYSGQPVVITSFGKVMGADVSRAQIVNQEFFLVEGAETVGRIINRSNAIPATVVSSTPTQVRYKSDWKFTMPQLKTGATYRIWSKINCQPKLQALNYTPERKTVLGTSVPTQPKSFIDRMIAFLNNLFGAREAATTTSTPTPTSQAGTGTGIILEGPTPAGKKSLQLEPIYPVEIYQKTCSFIKFRGPQLGQ